MTKKYHSLPLSCGFALFFCLMAAAGLAQAGSFQTITKLKTPRPAPDFELLSADGKKRYRLSDYRGKIVLVNFWATWCPPCRKEMPSMQRLWEKLRQEDFIMLAVNVGEDEEDVFAFTFELDTVLDFPLLLDRSGEVTRSWSATALPSTFIVDRQGRITHRAIGGREWDSPELLQQLEALVHPKTTTRKIKD